MFFVFFVSEGSLLIISFYFTAAGVKCHVAAVKRPLNFAIVQIF